MPARARRAWFRKSSLKWSGYCQVWLWTSTIIECSVGGGPRRRTDSSGWISSVHRERLRKRRGKLHLEHMSRTMRARMIGCTCWAFLLLAGARSLVAAEPVPIADWLLTSDARDQSGNG